MERTRSDRLLLVADASVVLLALLVAPFWSPLSLLMTSSDGTVSDVSLLFIWLDDWPLVRPGAATVAAVVLGSLVNVDAANVTLGPLHPLGALGALDPATSGSVCVVFLTGTAYQVQNQINY